MLAAPDHGSVDTSSGTTFGEIASYACNIGFDVVGVMARLCLESGIWSHSAPVCHIKGKNTTSFYKLLPFILEVDNDSAYLPPS